MTQPLTLDDLKDRLQVECITVGYLSVSNLSAHDQAALKDSISSYQSGTTEDGYFLYIGQDNSEAYWSEFSKDFVMFILYCESLDIEYLRICG